MVLLGALLSALVLSSTASAGVSRYCKLLTARQVARPLGLKTVRTTSTSLSIPGKVGGRGRITLCAHKTPSDLVAESSVSKFDDATGARTAFASVVHSEQKAGRATKVHGAWTDAYDFGMDGFLVLKGRFMFHIQYASGAPGYARITSKVIAGLATRAVRKL
jgi:hypothetical protein